MVQEERSSHFGIVSQMDNWSMMIRVALRKIKECQEARAAAMSTERRLESLRGQYDGLKPKTGTSMGLSGDGPVADVFSGAAVAEKSSRSTVTSEESEEIAKLKKKITDTRQVHSALMRDFEELKGQVSLLAEDIIQCKFKQFDQIFVRLLECQTRFYSDGQDCITPYHAVIDYYRTKFPRRSEEEVPAMTGTDGAASVESADSGSSYDDDAGRAAKKKVRVIKKEAVKPPPPAVPPPKRTAVGRSRAMTTPATIEKDPADKFKGFIFSVKITVTTFFGLMLSACTESEPKETDILGMHFGFSTASSSGTTTETVKHVAKDPSLDLLSGMGSSAPEARSRSAQSGGDSSSADPRVSLTSFFDASKSDAVGGTHHDSDDFLSTMFGTPTTSIAASSTAPAPGTSLSGALGSEIGLHQPYDDVFSFVSPGAGVARPLSTAEAGHRRRLSTDSKAKSTSHIERSFLDGFLDESVVLDKKSTPRSRTPDAKHLEHSHSLASSAVPAVVDEKTFESSTDKSSKRDGSGASASSKLSFAHDRFKEVTAMYDAEDEAMRERSKAMDSIEKRMDAWEFDKYGSRRKIQNLLADLDSVLWEGCRWKKVSFTTDPKMIDRYYKKACMIIHPDKAKQKGLDAVKTAVCERAFTAINEAHTLFKKEHGST